MSTSGGEPKGSGTPGQPELTGRLIVRYADGVTDAQRGRLRAAARLDFVSDVALPNTELVEPAAGGLSVALMSLGRDADVLWVQPEQRYRLMAGPTDEPYFGEQWALHNTGQVVEGFEGVSDVDMNVPEAWQITRGDPGLVVAVIDSGVDFTHPDLAGRAWINTGEIPDNGIDDDGNGFIDDVHGWDFCGGDLDEFGVPEGDNTVFEPGNSHGTHVAGSIAASGNDYGIAGVAPDVQIMAIRFVSDGGGGLCGTDEQAIAAIEYAVAQGARIVNASWGGYGSSQALYDLIENAPDTLFVAAAGNDNVDNDVDPVIPASFDLPNILSVAAIHNGGHLAEFSNYGYESVDVSAPGEGILSTLPADSFGWRSGTSMAAANASGVAALAASVRPALLGDPEAFREHLIRTARALPSSRGWVAYPRLLDARGAVVDQPDIRRLDGLDRYATSGAISRATFVPGVPYLFIATGTSFPDALAGGAVAAQLGAPLLLVRQASIPGSTLAEIQRLQPQRIFVLGGPSVISDGVRSQLGTLDAVAPLPVRLWGPDRYATAADISNHWFAPGVETAFIATGANFPDALAGVPASERLGGPVLLTAKGSLPAATAVELARLQPQRIVILGGTSVISAAVASQLASFTSGAVNRWAGADRFATAGVVAAQAFPSAGSVFIANGLNFPDALAGGPSAGAFAGPLLLVSSTGVPLATAQQLQRLDPARIFVLGGPAVVEESVITQLESLFP
ncbi:MAG TPA: cell wall-binding repeat-containing protein [Methylomirabilota bacterium]|nr:cell wall-binding repeat-containing protein [Methylomirabilota bacterium]